jgi:hypothetical protein
VAACGPVFNNETNPSSLSNVVDLSSIGCEVPLAEVYAGIQL